MLNNLKNTHLAVEGEADSGYVLLEPSITEPSGIEASGTPISLSDYISSVYVVFFVIVIISAIITLVYFGFAYMTSDIISLKSNAKKRITSVLIGLGILLFSWILLNQINPDLASNLGGTSTDGYENVIFSGLKNLLP